MNDEILRNISTNPVRMVPGNMYDEVDPDTRQELAKKIMDQYFKGKPLDEESIPLFIDVSHPVHKMVIALETTARTN